MDPNIWIADTGATVHSTSNVKLAQDWRQETNNTVVVMGNGQEEEMTKTGIMPFSEIY
jgi:mRNA degradation ribonuclease J1/J2